LGYEITYDTEERAIIVRDKILELGNPTFENIQELIRSNNNVENPCSGISPRCDLAAHEQGRRAFGAVDAKITKTSWAETYP